MNKTERYIVGMLITLIVAVGGFMFVRVKNEDANNNLGPTQNTDAEIPVRLTEEFPDVDYTNSSINLEQILSGGPGKDGIPAISNPKFEPISTTSIPDNTRGVYINIDGVERFYPYNILVWHEIINDKINNSAFAVTFCPLCGSAVVYDRTVNGREIDFGVSGFLYESNMLMYDRLEKPTFWSQSIGEAIVGSKTGQQLERHPFQLLEISTVKSNFPGTEIMTTETGYSRQYDTQPYGNYAFEEDLLFPVSVEDRRYSAKEIFYIIPIENDSGETVKSVALRIGELTFGQLVGNTEFDLTAIRESTGEIFVRNSNNEQVAGYFEMWFSWATQHQGDGSVWDPT